jgi:hypothetical protein
VPAFSLLPFKIPYIRPPITQDVTSLKNSGMAEIGIQPHIIEAVLNHISGHKGGVAGVYNRAAYLPEKTAALARWADHLMAVVEGNDSKVVALRA